MGTNKKNAEILAEGFTVKICLPIYIIFNSYSNINQYSLAAQKKYQYVNVPAATDRTFHIKILERIAGIIIGQKAKKTCMINSHRNI